MSTPVFIVGCQGSGTTLLRLMLDSHPNLSCGPETRFLVDLEKVVGDQWERMALFGLSKQEWLERIASFFAGVHSEYAARRGKSRWVDKTPRYALCLPFIDQLFPEAQIVHVIRDGRDVVASHRRRWGVLSSLRAVEKWRRYIAAARSSPQAADPSRYTEVRYEDLVRDADATMRALLDFLGEPWDESVLRHEDAPHDVPERYRERAAARRAEGGEGSAVYASGVGAHARSLDPLTRLAFRVRCGRLLRAVGYR